MTFKILLYDAMNALRVRAETERPNMLVRGIVNETMMPGPMRIWIWDGMYGNAQRRKIFPAYKLHRQQTAAGQNIFKTLDLLRNILSHTNAWQCRHDQFEGDDLIAALVKQFPNDRIKIISSDRDFLALTDGHRVTCTAKPYTKVNVPNHFIKLYKLTVGDRSDGIPGLPGFGDESWTKCDKFALASVLDRVMANAPPRSNTIEAAHLGRRAREWLARPEAPGDLRIMKTIIAPLPVSPEQMETALWQGRDNPEAREALMKEFLL